MGTMTRFRNIYDCFGVFVRWEKVQGYYFNSEKHGACWFAYIYREEDDAATSPPVKQFHSQADDDEGVCQLAQEWIREHGVIV